MENFIFCTVYSWSLFSTCCFCSSTHPFLPLPANKVPNKLASNVPNHMLGNPSPCSFASYSMFSLELLINEPDSSRYLTIFITSPISLFGIIDIVGPEARFFSLISASTGYVAAVSSRGIKTLLANGLILFLNIGPRSLPKNPPNCIILKIYVFDSFVLADELFAKSSESFETCLSS